MKWETLSEDAEVKEKVKTFRENKKKLGVRKKVVNRR